VREIVKDLFILDSLTADPVRYQTEGLLIRRGRGPVVLGLRQLVAV